ncbi:hypothetical protein E4U42_000303 [Claviceps africana]|uniref:Uncharacterized protein n=1 Tax=Claviceps africana TaxID=83212 RepID=A0A8K0J066_9HYPO|nr:hypothetical protein E4U42_000303 [Claviceps africana]
MPRPRPRPRRWYSTRPDAEPAEFTAEKPTSNTTKMFVVARVMTDHPPQSTWANRIGSIVAGLTVLVAGVYAAAAGTPGEAAKTAAATDPEGVEEFMPPHGGREAGRGRGRG